MNIFDYFKKNNIDTVDASFYRDIKAWISWYKGNVRNFSTYKVYSGQGTCVKRRRKTIGMAKKLSEDIADLLLNERVTITISDDKTNRYVENVLSENRFHVMGNDFQERKAYTGTVAYVPYLYDCDVDEDGNVLSGKIGINYVEAPNIFPVSWQNGNVTECIFLFPHTVNRRKYIHIQFHRLAENEETGQTEYVIENTVLENVQGISEGKEIPEDEWRKLKPFRNLAHTIRTGAPEPQFVIDRLNITNNSGEDNPMGIAIFANSIDLLKKLDVEFDSYSNEFEMGRKRIFVAPEMLSNINGSYAFDPEDCVFYMLPDDYAKAGEGMIKEINMELRAEQHSKAITDDLNLLSMKCGFGMNRYRFDSTGLKTATEVISENSDLYRMLKKHEIILKDVIETLVHIIIRLGISTGEKLNEDSEIVIDFDDSIIEDKQAERQSDRQDVSMGAMTLEEYRAKWYGETVEQARTKIVTEDEDPDMDEE